MIEYRSFRNTDPPGLVDVWNASFTGRGAAQLRTATLLEYFTFAKPYFDPEGLIVAWADARPVGFVHAGFGPTDDQAHLDPTVGVVCSLGVVPQYRRQGVGSELLRRAEAYLRGKGVRVLHAGPLEPLNPFTFGLYGGGQSPGFLDSDALARPFLERHRYKAHEGHLVLHRTLDAAPSVADARFGAYRPRYEIRVGPLSHCTWWRECVLGPLELHDYRLVDKTTEAVAARVVLWEMEPYSTAWNEHGVGIAELEVPPDLRRKGLAKFLIAQILRHVHEQFFTLVEAQAPEGNAAAVKLFLGLGFKQVDRGFRYTREEGPAA